MQQAGNLDLYSVNNHDNTLLGSGFKDMATAQRTLKLISKRSIIYQKILINTMYYRAKHHPNKTDDMIKVMKFYKKWLTKNNNVKPKYNYLDLKLVNKYEKLANAYDISHVSRGLKKSVKSDYGFLVMYRKCKGVSRKLAFVGVHKNKPTGADYDILRENFINARLGQMTKSKIKLYNSDGEFKNLPTVQHCVLIMNGYSPDPEGLKKRVGMLNKI